MQSTFIDFNPSGFPDSNDNPLLTNNLFFFIVGNLH